MIYVIIVCVIIIGFLGIKLCQKQKIDKEEFQLYNEQLKQVKQDVANTWTDFHLASQNLETVNNTLKRAKEETEYEKYKLEECKKDLQAALDVYQDITDNKLKEIDASMDEQRQKRQEDLDRQYNERKEKFELALSKRVEDCQNEMNRMLEAQEQVCGECMAKILDYRNQEQAAHQRYESLLEPIKQYEKEKQERLFYTIQLPEEYQEDIEFLLTTVAAKVQHPDIISKLVWTEYVKPYIEETFKRIEIKAEPGIYKLTSLETGKAYIGKSTDVKKRIADHFKSTVGIKSIADQAVHHAILKEGFWNWTIEIITYADKDKLNELEKYYIEFFKTQEFGYNKNSGGGG